MLDCIDCTALAAKADAASKKENGLLHEVERLREGIATIQRRLDAEAAQRRHWVRIACDRCGDTMEFSTTLASCEEARSGVMRDAIDRLGWMVSDATAIGLGMEVGIGGPDRCAACVRIYHGAPVG